MGTPTLEVRDLTVPGTHGIACRGVSLVARRGELVCVLGGPGAGKSQLLRGIGLDLAPVSGSVRVDGVVVSAMASDRRRQMRAGVIELVHPPAAGAPADPAGPGAHAALVLAPRRGVTVPAAGMRQRIQIARALTHRTRILLLDEPLAGVEDAVRWRILELLGRARSEAGTAVVVATRHADTVALLGADQVVVLEGGEVVGAGTPDQILGTPFARARAGFRRARQGRRSA
jgi:ABC-type multidrug transport system ATPase subunit